MENYKVILSNKQVTNQLKNLISEMNQLPTPEEDAKYKEEFDKLLNVVRKSLKKYPFVEDVGLDIKILDYDGVGGKKYFYYPRFEILMDIDKMPNYDDLHSFIKHFFKIKKHSGFFTDLSNFYETEESKKLGEELSQKIKSNLELAYNFYLPYMSLEKEDMSIGFHFKY